MRALTPWLPSRALSTIHDEIDDLFSSFFKGEDAWFEGRFAPAVDTFVKDGNVVIMVDLPGIDPKSVDVTVDRDRVTITGERKAQHEENEAGTHYREVRYGRFERTVRLPGPIDPDGVSARFRDGVLEISMKAPAGTEPTRVPIAAE
jgi:HSP20 family protein